MTLVTDQETSESTLTSAGLRRPSELIYRTCYAPVDLEGLLATAENRSRIRRLSVPQLYFGLKELGEHRIQALLPHITEAQWQGVLDLDLWNRDRANAGKFLFWAAQIVQAESPVARKIVRGTDRQLLELWLKRRLRFEEIIEEDPGLIPKGDFMETPDRSYLVQLPGNPEESRLARALLLKLYELARRRPASGSRNPVTGPPSNWRRPPIKIGNGGSRTWVSKTTSTPWTCTPICHRERPFRKKYGTNCEPSAPCPPRSPG